MNEQTKSELCAIKTEEKKAVEKTRHSKITSM